ncbi:MAG TPA: aminopeptidase P N-terminal domain-containing protein, partial [Gemmatimonadaceae bacterium]|nr:aminopeptidase P N-terminal domain-containing protein [Gemmatimonadaceae bacterium]
MRRRLLIAALLAPAIAARAQVPREEYAARRAALAARLPDSAVLIALGAREPREDYVTFVQAPDFWYLTGFLEADADLLLVKRGARVSATMFVLPRDLAIEMWTGPRAGLDSAAARSGLATQRVGEFRSALDSAIAGAKSIYVVGDLDAGAALSADDQFVESLEREHPGLIIVNAAVVVDSLRSRKSAAELALLRRAIGITVRAESAAMRTVAPDLPEYRVQAVIEETFRWDGAERPGFATIVGSGPNATSLHHAAGDRAMRAGELVVMDIGASFGGYSADVTRTVPVSGTFTAEQHALYQVVRDAQAAAERAAVLNAN